MAEPGPLDELNVQLPGRMLALEIVVTLLLRQKANPRAIMQAADERLTALEALEIPLAETRGSDYALKLFAAARENLDTMAAQSRR